MHTSMSGTCMLFHPVHMLDAYLNIIHQEQLAIVPAS